MADQDAAAKGLRNASSKLSSVQKKGLIAVASELAKHARSALATAPGRYSKSMLSIRATTDSLTLSGPTAIGGEFGRTRHDTYGRNMSLHSSGLQSIWPPRVKGEGWIVGRAWANYEKEATELMADLALETIDRELDRQGVF